MSAKCGSAPRVSVADPPAGANVAAQDIRVERLSTLAPADIRALAEVLVDCVAGGASVSFMHPLTLERAVAYWSGLGDEVARGERIMLVARDSHGIAGTVQVILSQPENQPHRADVAKMLVHQRARRRGVGRALLIAAQSAARAAGKTLLVLDTADAGAARLYERLGWIAAGVIPGYALLPHGGLCDTTYYYRQLA